jgi:hypothetical protein
MVLSIIAYSLSASPAKCWNTFPTPCFSPSGSSADAHSSRSQSAPADRARAPRPDSGTAPLPQTAGCPPPCRPHDPHGPAASLDPLPLIVAQSITSHHRLHTLRARSKHRSMGACITVISSSLTINGGRNHVQSRRMTEIKTLPLTIDIPSSTNV